MRALLLSSILLAGLLAGCTGDSPSTPTGSQTNSGTTAAPFTPTPADLPLDLNITGDIGLRIATAGPDDCEIHVAAVFTTAGPGPWMMVLEESSGARFLFGHTAPAVHAAGYDSFQPGGDPGVQAWHVWVGSQPKDSVTIAVKNLTWFPNEFTGNHSTLKVWTECRVEAVQHFSSVQLADGYTFRGGTGVVTLEGAANMDDRWSFTTPGNATMVGRHDHDVFRMDIQTPTAPLLWEDRLFVAQGAPGRYEATLNTVSRDSLLMLAVLA
jgi:hypothetical protein